jgi:diguanylate cyclase (GGDEF)-like protein/PAS domain S-box-containing protein
MLEHAPMPRAGFDSARDSAERTERERLAELAEYQILDTPPEPEFDDLAALAAQIAGVPMAIVSLMDADRQWYKARVGIDATAVPRDVTFCDHVVSSGAELEVPDARRDARFADNPMVCGDPHIVFYAGFPLCSPQGHVLGTLCVIGYEPKQLDVQCRTALRTLAQQAMTQLEFRRLAAEQAVEISQRRAAEQALARSQRDLQLLAENATDIVTRHASDGRVTYVSPSIRQILGYSPEMTIGGLPADIVHPDDEQPLADAFNSAVAGAPTQVIIRSRAIDGNYRYLETHLKRIDFEAGRWEIRSAARDVTDRIATEQRLDALVASLLAITDLELSSNVVLPEICRHATLLTNADSASIEVLQDLSLTVRAASGVLETVIGTSFPVAESLSGSAVAQNRAVVSTDVDADERVHPDAARLGMRSVMVVPLRRGGRVLGTLKVATSRVDSFDSSDRQSLELLAAPLGAILDNTWRFEENTIQALTDPLTGLANRAEAMRALQRALDRQTRFGGCTTLIFIDLDGFKAVNDQLGHAAGDELLRGFAERLRGAVRATDVPARIGGDEFLIICETVPSVASARLAANRFAQLLADVPRDFRTPPVQASIGVAVAVDATDPQTLMQAADAAMYEAKAALNSRDNRHDNRGYVMRVVSTTS